MLTEPCYSCQEKTQHDKSRHDPCQQETWLSSRVGPNLVQWQLPNGGRFASGFMVGTSSSFSCFSAGERLSPHSRTLEVRPNKKLQPHYDYDVKGMILFTIRCLRCMIWCCWVID